MAATVCPAASFAGKVPLVAVGGMLAGAVRSVMAVASLEAGDKGTAEVVSLQEAAAVRGQLDDAQPNRSSVLRDLGFARCTAKPGCCSGDGTPLALVPAALRLGS